MPRVLLTAFEPFGTYAENSSRLCLRAVQDDPPPGLELTTRLYPVEFDSVRALLARDLEHDFAASLHLGQAGRSRSVELEAFAINAGGYPGQDAAEFHLLELQGPAAYRSPLPLPHWAARLQSEGFPVAISFHAGTYLCNATSYWAQHWCATRGRPIRSLFVHLPLAVEQADAAAAAAPNLEGSQGQALPLATMAAAVRRILILLAAESTVPG